MIPYKFPEHITHIDQLLDQKGWRGQDNQGERLTHPLAGTEVQIRIYREDDESPDLSYLGEFTSEPSGDFIFDRATGFLHGDMEVIRMGKKTFAERVLPLQEEKTFAPVFTYKGKRYLLADSACKNEWHNNEEYRIPQPDTFDVDVRPLYAEGGKTGEFFDERRQMRYVHGFQHSLRDVGHEYKKEGKTERLTLAEVAGYCLQDASLLCTYGDDWHCVGIGAQVYLDGVEIADSSLWGVEYGVPSRSASEKYHLEVAADQVVESLAQAERWIGKNLQPSKEQTA